MAELGPTQLHNNRWVAGHKTWTTTVHWYSKRASCVPS